MSEMIINSVQMQLTILNLATENERRTEPV